ncbi:hypothetical protein F8B43_3586 [Methylorubrum populi]|uniref:Uncharacterized protein n=1 Tax=Methylorubrum populi TaxID=223967 RepID=A0A833J2Z1_9HYPH|nr:hypothetical protein F8B43_3586 [Methylorubrum populi]
MAPAEMLKAAVGGLREPRRPLQHVCALPLWTTLGFIGPHRIRSGG